MTTSFSKAQYVSGEHEDCPESLLQIIMEEVDEIVYAVSYTHLTLPTKA